MNRDKERGATITATDLADSSPRASTELERGAALGRYLVLEQLGAGGMGIVYSAYDPELDRKVALKLLRPSLVADQTRLRREAQAMARLQHTNVVAVHDVGLYRDRMFVAMELVNGTTLSQWLKERPRSYPAILDVFRQAGRGLAAAHAVGLMHRDFKLSNVLIGPDGRVRVVDFGLARAVPSSGGEHSDQPPSTTSMSGGEHSAQPPPTDSISELHVLGATITCSGAFIGTPTYMAPEQFLGLPTDARTDQFSFCVALYRALFGERPFGGEDLATISDEVTHGRLRALPKDSRVPSWVAQVVLRGLAIDPSHRWPSMDALLVALARDPAKTKSRWLWGSLAFVALASLIVGYATLQRRGAMVCRGAERKLVGVWDDERKRAVHASFAATGNSSAEEVFQTVTRAFDAYASQWVTAHTRACEATRILREQSEELLDLRMECLDERLQEVEAQVDLFSAADAGVIAQAAQMAASLTSLRGCSDLAALRAPLRPPADPRTRTRVEEVRKKIARAKVLQGAGKFAEALAVAAPTAAEARDLKYWPLESDALLRLGLIQQASSQLETAETTLEDAAFAARAGRDVSNEQLVAAAMAKLKTGRLQYDEAHRWLRRGFAASTSVGDSDEQSLATLLGAASVLATARGSRAEALDYSKRVVAIRERVDGPESYTFGAALVDLGAKHASLGEYEKAKPLIRRGQPILERQLGPESPSVGWALFHLGYAHRRLREYDDAVLCFRRSLDIQQKAFGPMHPRLASVLGNLGDVLVAQGKYEEALQTFQREWAIAQTLPPQHPERGCALTSMGDVLRLKGKRNEALDYYRRGLSILEKNEGQDSMIASALVGIGLTELDGHAPARALAVLEQAVVIREKHTADVGGLAEARFGLARALWASGTNRARALQLAALARSGFASMSAASPKELAEVDAWRANHR